MNAVSSFTVVVAEGIRATQQHNNTTGWVWYPTHATVVVDGSYSGDATGGIFDHATVELHSVKSNRGRTLFEQQENFTQ
jgi:hypothetical protein